MTEYDYSPDAWERYIESQHRIARWVDGTLTQEPCNAFAPTTPHIKFLQLQEDEKRRRKEAKTVVSSTRPSKDRRHSYDVRYREDRKYRSDTEDEDYEDQYRRSSSRTSRRHRDASHVSSSGRYESSSSTRYSSSRDKDRSERPRSDRRSSVQTTPTRRDSEPVVLRGQGYVLVEKEKSHTTHNTPTSTRASTPTSATTPSKTRPRSRSVAAPSSKHTRSQTSPNLALDLPPLGQPHNVHDPYYYTYGRNSADATVHSSTTRPSTGSTTNGAFHPHHYPAQVGPAPNSAPPIVRHAPQPVRSYTVPPSHHAYSNGFIGPSKPSVSPDPSKVPQLPYSAYTSSPTKATQSTSLLKRMFTGLTINKQSRSTSPKPKAPSPTKTKESNVPSGGRRVLRKRSSSF